jgi:tetratricopeptide (TPR) repeat protein
MRIDPLSRTAWTDLADVRMSLGEQEQAAEIIDEARGRLGDNNRLREHRARLALHMGDTETAIALMQHDFLESVDYQYFKPVLTYLQGDADRALRLVDQMEAENPWPNQYMEIPLTFLGERERVREIIGQIDALTAGPTILAVNLSIYRGLIAFDLHDAPRLKALLDETGIDASFYETEPAGD